MPQLYVLTPCRRHARVTWGSVSPRARSPTSSVLLYVYNTDRQEYLAVPAVRISLVHFSPSARDRLGPPAAMCRTRERRSAIPRPRRRGTSAAAGPSLDSFAINRRERAGSRAQSACSRVCVCVSGELVTTTHGCYSILPSVEVERKGQGVRLVVPFILRNGGQRVRARFRPVIRSIN
jgi:hypothetical protein